MAPRAVLRRWHRPPDGESMYIDCLLEEFFQLLGDWVNRQDVRLDSKGMSQRRWIRRKARFRSGWPEVRALEKAAEQNLAQLGAINEQ